MADNKKYYYLKLKDNFYDSEEMIILQNMPDGYLYSDILMKLYLRSLKNGGKLMFNNLLPYTPSVLAQVVRHQVGTVEKALKIFQDLGLVEILDNGAIYMLDIQNLIGKSSTEADRIREYRNKISSDKNSVQMLQQTNDKTTPEIELEIELKKESEIELQQEEIVQLDSCVDEVVDFYKKNIKDDSPYSTDVLSEYVKKLSKEVVVYAIKLAIEQNKKNIAYIRGILNNWNKQGVKTLEEAEKANQNYQDNKCHNQKGYKQREYANLNDLIANK